MEHAQSVEHELLEQVAQEYAQQGYRVFREPGVSELPVFLRGFRPDLLVETQDEKIIVEIKTRGTPDARNQLRHIAEEVNKHSGWRLRVVWAQPSMEKEEPEKVLPSLQEILEKLSSVEDLYSTGQQVASFLLLWSLLEAAIKRRLMDIDVERDIPLSASALVKDLVAYGFIDQEGYNTALELALLRNKAAHGQPTISIDRDVFDSLSKWVKDLVEHNDVHEAEGIADS